jgi:hypothetical protein
MYGDISELTAREVSTAQEVTVQKLLKERADLKEDDLVVDKRLRKKRRVDIPTPSREIPARVILRNFPELVGEYTLNGLNGTGFDPPMQPIPLGIDHMGLFPVDLPTWILDAAEIDRRPNRPVEAPPQQKAAAPQVFFPSHVLTYRHRTNTRP